MISLKVEFSEEEKRIIADAKIEKVIILERKPSVHIKANFEGIEDVWFITYDKLLYKQSKGEADEYCVLSPVDARIYDEELKKALREAKDYLEANRNIEQKSTTFEL